MKKSFLTFLLVALLAPLCLTSCSEDDNEVEEFPNWRQTNEEQLAALYERAQSVTDGSWKVIKNYTLESAVTGTAANSIVVEVLQAGTGSGSPMFSDSVKINYRGRLLPSTSYPDGYVFDESYTGDYNPATANPVTMYVGELVDGFATALQNMRIGDHWRVYMPKRHNYVSEVTDNLSVTFLLPVGLQLPVVAIPPVLAEFAPHVFLLRQPHSKRMHSAL